MLSVDLLQPLRKRLFEPFRILVSDGTTYDVRHPELVINSRTSRSASIGVRCLYGGAKAKHLLAAFVAFG